MVRWGIQMDQEKQEKKVIEKKPYSSPILWVHGGIGELTQTSTQFGPNIDVRSKAADRTG